jgi:hypothetical protein
MARKTKATRSLFFIGVLGVLVLEWCLGRVEVVVFGAANRILHNQLKGRCSPWRVQNKTVGLG